MSRQKALVACFILVLSMGAPLVLGIAALAGDVDSPEMEDSHGDSTSGRDPRDLVSGWVTNETETSIEFNLRMAALDPLTPFSDWQTLPVVYYEFFFDVTTPGGMSSFSARAMIPVHGPTAAFAQYEVFKVNYTAQGTVGDETLVGSSNGRYLFNAATISITVDKANMGDPARGDLMSGVWARITSTSQRGSGDIITEDTMLSHVSPGKTFSFSGGVTFYSVMLQANVTQSNATSDQPATFEVVINSTSEKQANVSLRNTSTMPTNWTLRTDQAVYIVSPGASVRALVTITPAANRSNETRRVTIVGEFKSDQNANLTTENSVTFTVVVPPLPGGGGGGGGGGDGGGTGVSSNTGVWIAIAGVVAVAAVAIAVVGYILPQRKKKLARQRLQRMSQKAWSRSPRSGPTGAGPGAAPAPRVPQRTAGPPGPRPR